MTFLFARGFVGVSFILMLFKRTRELIDLELGPLEARTSILPTSLVKWQKSIAFLDNDVVLEVYGTIKMVNHEERATMVEVLRKKEVLEKQVLEVIAGFCTKYGLNLDAWGNYFKCSRIYSQNQNLYVSMSDTLNKLTYEIEVKGFNQMYDFKDTPIF